MRSSAAAVARPGTNRLNGLQLLLYALVVLTVSRIHQHFPALSTVRPALMLSLLAIGFALANPRYMSARGEWLKTWPARVVVALGVLACFSVVFGVSMGRAGRFVIEEYSKVLVFACLLMAAMGRPRDVRLYVWAFVVSTGVLVWMSLFVFGLSKAGADGINRLSNLYTYDANDVGAVLLAGLGLTLLTFHTSRLWGKVLSLAIIVGIGASLARTGSRGAFVGLLAAGVVLFFALSRVSLLKRLAFVAVTIVSLNLTSPAGYWDQMFTVFKPKEDYNWSSETGRRKLAIRGFSYMFKYPLFGLGVYNFPMADFERRQQDWSEGEAGVWVAAPHNSYVEVAAEMGIPGFVLWTSLACGGIFAMYRLRRRMPRHWERGDPEQRFLHAATMYLPVGQAGFATSAAFVSFAYLDLVYILAAFMSGLYVAVGRKLREEVPQVEQTGAQFAVPAVRPLERGGWRGGLAAPLA